MLFAARAYKKRHGSWLNPDQFKPSTVTIAFL